MDYHKDRFEDYSIMVFKKDELIALLAANIFENKLYSHQGLTYGGIILRPNTSLIEIELIFELILRFLKKNGFEKLILKTFPGLYAIQRNEELDFILNKNKASIIHQNLIFAIDYNSKYKIYKSKLKRYRKFESGNFQIKVGIAEFEHFWNLLLEPRLNEKHNTKPVHSLNEIKGLHYAFPKKIVQYNLYQDEELLAGITIFKTKTAVKSQYGIASEKGEKVGALDMLFVHLINMFKGEKFQYFSMGRINDSAFKNGYNVGMLKQKQEFGCELHLQPVYELVLNG